MCSSVWASGLWGRNTVLWTEEEISGQSDYSEQHADSQLASTKGARLIRQSVGVR